MFGPYAAGRDDRARHDDHAGARDDALLDRALEPHVRIPGALGAQIPDRGESGEQRVAGVIRRARDAQRDGFVQNLIIPGRFVVGMQEQVRMPFDQPGEQRRTGQIDRRRARWCATSAAGPTAEILSPVTSTTQPS